MLASKYEAARILRRNIKEEWDTLWNTKVYDKDRSEGVSTKKFHLLSIEAAQVLHDSRGSSMPCLDDIYEGLVGKEVTDRVVTYPKVGGWKKFAKNTFPPIKPPRKIKVSKNKNQQQRKGGRGWLNKFKQSK